MTPILTPTELRAILAKAEALFGESFDDLVRSWSLGASSPTPPPYPHRLLDLVQRIRHAADNRDDLLAYEAALVAATEVSGLVSLFDEWRGDPVWPEFRRAIQDPRNFLHAVVVLSMASGLRQHHRRTELVASGVMGGSADLRMVVTDSDFMAVEVKTALSLTNRKSPMSASEAIQFVEAQLRRPKKGGKRQLDPNHPGLLVVGGFAIDKSTMAALGDAAGYVLERKPRPNLWGIVISHTFTKAIRESGRPVVEFAHLSRIRSSRHYRGNLRFVGDWAGDWRLEKID